MKIGGQLEGRDPYWGLLSGEDLFEVCPFIIFKACWLLPANQLVSTYSPEAAKPRAPICLIKHGSVEYSILATWKTNEGAKNTK